MPKSSSCSACFLVGESGTGETFTAQLWYLNDLPECAEDAVAVSLTVNGESLELLEWKTGVVEANQNKIGPSVNFVLPQEAEENELILTLTGASGRTNSYILHFAGKVPAKRKSLAMNM